MAITYIAQNLKFNIYISKEDIDSSDRVKIYSFTDDNPTSGPTDVLEIAKIRSSTTRVDAEDPSQIDERDFYFFQHTEVIREPGTYNYYYTVIDTSNNESDPVEFFQEIICLVPADPGIIDFDSIDWGTAQDVVITTDLISDTVTQYKMNDNIPNTNVINSMVDNPSFSSIDATYVGANTEDKSVIGKINGALSFNGSSNYINSNQSFDNVFNDSFSINLWVQVPNFNSDETFCSTKISTTSFVEFFHDEDEISFSYVAPGGVTKNTNIGSIFGAETTGWHMITANVEPLTSSTMRITLFFDGQSVVSQDHSSIDMSGYVSSDNLFIGAQSGGAGPANYFQGNIDNFCIFDKVLSQDDINFLYYSRQGTEDLAFNDDYYTIYHYDIDDIDNPSELVKDGDFPIDTETFGLAIPIDSQYEYYWTQTNIDCDTTSEGSDVLPIIVVDGVPGELPYQDSENIFINNTSNGRFVLNFNYNSIAQDPITAFNIYRKLENPSVENPSVETGVFILDGSISYSAQTNRFSYTTQPLPHDTQVDYKVVPVAITTERESILFVSGIADSEAPVVVTDFTEVILE